MIDYEATNLINNLENRSPRSDFKAIKTAAVYDAYASDPDNPVGDPQASRISGQTCFKSTGTELAASNYKMITGIDFREPVFMHAVTHVQDSRSGSSYEYTDEYGLY